MMMMMMMIIIIIITTVRGSYETQNSRNAVYKSDLTIYVKNVPVLEVPGSPIFSAYKG
jgi:hypothetical protein